MATSGEADRVFETHLQTYLINNGVRPADAQQVDAEAVLDSARSVGGEAIPPLAGPVGLPAPEFQLQLQKYLLSKEIAHETVLSLTPDHLLASVKEQFTDDENVAPSTEVPDSSLATSHEDQAAQRYSPEPNLEATKRDTTPIDSVLADDDDDLFGEGPAAPIKEPSLPAEDYDSDYEDDEPISHRRRKGIAQKKPRTTTAAASKEPKQVETACLAALQPHPQALYNTHQHDLQYITFINNYLYYLGYRFAAVCLTLHRANRSDDAAAIGQFAVDLMGKEIFEAFVLLFEKQGDEGDSVQNAKVCLAECLDEINLGYGFEPCQELRARVIGTGMRFGF